MKIVVDEIIEEEIKDYLLTQDGINKIDIDIKGDLTEINIDHNDNTNPIIIYKCIELFLSNTYPILVSFDKNNIANYNSLKYKIDDMCCEYCYKKFVTEMFNNPNIKALSSNFNFNKPAIDIEISIEFSRGISEEEIKKICDIIC